MFPKVLGNSTEADCRGKAIATQVPKTKWRPESRHLMGSCCEAIDYAASLTG
jgi:hypothetical protein